MVPTGMTYIVAVAAFGGHLKQRHDGLPLLSVGLYPVAVNLDCDQVCHLMSNDMMDKMGRILPVEGGVES
ncbi:hypothetical protein GCM10023116_14740 [Kistimonas scapharcae]|uniref:Uncharacterized protein n=1 Tax=Kistimonas scapharcae TaxID=1036133 RepID=A0ABP8UZC2_9GAMM